MTFPADSTCLPDVNVRIAVAADRHEHHATARQWFDSVSVPVCFCRITQMAFLRLLTNPQVMGEDILRPVEAIGVYRQLLTDERIRYAPEPPSIENDWISLMSIRGRKRQHVDRCVSGRVRDGCRLPADHLRSRYGSVAGSGLGIIEARLAEPRGRGNPVLSCSFLVAQNTPEAWTQPVGQCTDGLRFGQSGTQTLPRTPFPANCEVAGICAIT
jgi:predicted nucleic acid-binding protein